METILKLFLGFLADFLLPFLSRLREARADNPKLWEVAETIIVQISDAHPEWEGAQKRAYAFDAIKVAGRELVGDLTDSAVNTMIELIVQKVKTTPAVKK